MKTWRPLFLIMMLWCFGESMAQPSSSDFPEFSLRKTEISAHLRFLASDELQGRRTGEQSNRVAARYIAEQFLKYGVKHVPGKQDYYQTVWFEKTGRVGKGTLVAGADSLKAGTDWLMMSGQAVDLEAPVVYAGYGLEDAAKGWDDYKGLDVKGKIVLVQGGFPESQTPRESLAASVPKRKTAAAKGALALIELYNATTPWPMISQALSGERLGLAPEKEEEVVTLTHIWVNGREPKLARQLREAGVARIRSEARHVERVSSYNVAGFIEGTDPRLREQYILLSAHYDHVGVGVQGGQPFTPEDSIFNGARDNAFGTTALLAAAESFGLQRPARSVLLVAFTGEELGLLGSRFYTQNPLLPLGKCIFNLNSDGAGYNDTTVVSVIGYLRTGAGSEIAKAAKAFGLGVVGDPVEEQNLFDRSDNVNFAIQGIPAPTFTPGFRDFNEEIMRTYHQVSDNPETVNYDYLLKFSQAYVYAARLVAGLPQPPQWIKGDKYEEAARKLYGR